MSVLWCGGEDIDFPIGAALSIQTGAPYFRAGYARLGIAQGAGPEAGFSHSKAFPGGAVTSAWLSYRIYPTGNIANYLGMGFGLSGTNKSLLVGASSSSGTKYALWKYDGTTKTQLAAESGNSLALIMARIDMQVINYGASATVNVYLNSNLIITFTGDVTVSGMTNFDHVIIDGNSAFYYFSEVIVADEDLRGWVGLVTLAPNANGTTQAWTNPGFANVNPTTINDANAASAASSGLDVQWKLNALPAGSGGVKAIKVATRAFMSTGTANIQNGFNSGGTVAVSAAQAVTTAPATFENIYAVNPVTGVAWGAEVNTLQIDLRSA